MNGADGDDRERWRTAGSDRGWRRRRLPLSSLAYESQGLGEASPHRCGCAIDERRGGGRCKRSGACTGLESETETASDVRNFLDSSGSPQVSIIVLPDYKPPLAACAMNEVLEWISSEATSSERVLIIPFITRPSSYHHGTVRATEALPVLHGAEIGATTDFSHLLVDGTTKPPTSLQIRSEPILCLLEMVQVLKMPAVLLVASGRPQQAKRSAESDLEVLQYIGEHLARRINLEFSKEIIREREVQKSPIVQEPWRELYG